MKRSLILLFAGLCIFSATQASAQSKDWKGWKKVPSDDPKIEANYYHSNHNCDVATLRENEAREGLI